jgi:adenylosuccinate synthase
LSPVYLEIPIWKEDISRCKNFDDLPVEAKNYVRNMITSICKVAYGENWAKMRLPELLYIGVGPNPGQVIQNLPPVTEILDFS